MRYTPALVLVLACSTATPPTVRPLSCPAPDQLYTVHYVEQIGGTCGGIPDTITTGAALLAPRCNTVVTPPCHIVADCGTYTFEEDLPGRAILTMSYCTAEYEVTLR